MNQLTKEQAIAFFDGGAWAQMSLPERAAFQIEQDLLCMPFSSFHEAMEHVLGRPIWTHEFALRDALRDEMAGKVEPPSFADILAKLPAEKTVVVVTS